jgi:hypothetical protein
MLNVSEKQDSIPQDVESSETADLPMKQRIEY